MHSSWPTWDLLVGKYLLRPLCLPVLRAINVKILLSVLMALVGLLGLAFDVFAVLQRTESNAQSEPPTKGGSPNYHCTTTGCSRKIPNTNPRDLCFHCLTPYHDMTVMNVSTMHLGRVPKAQ